VDAVDPPRLTPRGVVHAARLGDRSLFPGLDALVYVNHAAIAPPSVASKHAVVTWIDDAMKRGAAAFPTWIAQRDRLRGKLAALVGARSSEIALEPNTSRGVSDVAQCLRWRPGDRVVLFEGEFPANVTPWLLAARRHGLEVRWLRAADFAGDLDAALVGLEAALEGARLCAVSAVQFQTGLRMPLAAIGERCRARGVRLFVDAVQAVGMVPIDVRAAGVDFLACGSHKWLMGVEGAGFLYAAEERWDELEPHVAGWLSHEDGLGFLFDGPGLLRYDRPIVRGPVFVEGGNVATASFAALEASVDLLLSLGVPAIFDHVQAFHDRLEPELVRLGLTSVRCDDPARRSGSLSFVPPAGVPIAALHRQMGRFGIACSMPDGHLRIAPHWPNAIDEADQVVVSAEAALAAVRRGEVEAPPDPL
jgi:selenocysteine lyase/cysteine desulfurase